MARTDATVSVRSFESFPEDGAFHSFLTIAITEPSRSARQSVKMEYVGGNVEDRDAGRTWEGEHDVLVVVFLCVVVAV